MTVAFQDAPGQVARSEPINLTATGSVIAISVRINGRVEERAYRDGAFLYPYLRSSKNGIAYELVRDGGWPDPGTFDVFVDEDSGPSPGGHSWGAVHAIDFTGLPSLDLAAVGAHEIDGLEWWAKGALTGQPFGNVQTNAIDAGSGLRFSTSGGAQWLGGAIDYPYRLLFLPLENVPNYNPDAPVLIRWRASSSTPNIICGLLSTASDGSNVLAADRASEVMIATGDQVGSTSPWFKRGTSFPAAGQNYGVGQERGELAVCRYLGELTVELRATSTWGGSFPDADAALRGEAGISGSADAPTRANPGIGVCMTGQVGTPVYLTHLSIWQPKVPA